MKESFSNFLNCRHVSDCDVINGNGCPIRTDDAYVNLLARIELLGDMSQANREEAVEELARQGIDQENGHAELEAVRTCKKTADRFRLSLEAQRRLIQAGLSGQTGLVEKQNQPSQ